MITRLMILALVSCTTETTPSVSGDWGPAGDTLHGDYALGGDRNTFTGDDSFADIWPWCPDSSAYVGGDWPYQVTVTDGVLLCVVNNGAESSDGLRDALANKAQLRLIAGTYPLPDQAGDYTMTLPACLRRASGQPSTLDGDGTLMVSTVDRIGDTVRAYALTQSLLVDSELWRLDLNVRVRYPNGEQPEPLTLDNTVTSGSYPSVFYDLETASYLYPWPVYPCVEYDGAARTKGVTFDRGRLEVQDRVYEVIGAGHLPAMLTRAWGQLDGVSFDEQDYFSLAHIPDHHNLGGAFLVVFDAPIGNACGIEAYIPSGDGSSFPEGLAAWTVDCNLDRVDALSGIATL